MTTTLEYDVVVVGAGAAGLRAAIEATSEGARTAVICKSLLGKAGTVMAEDAITAVDCLRELKAWGALLDSTRRTGLEVLRVLQSRAVALGIDVHMECDVKRLVTTGSRIAGVFGYRRATGEFVLFRCRAVVLATGGARRVWKEGAAEATGDGLALALSAGAQLVDMDLTQSGGVSVDPRSAASAVPWLFAVGDVAAGQHGLSEALGSGRRGGSHAARYCRASKRVAAIDLAAIEEHRRVLLRPFQRASGENPYALLRELQGCITCPDLDKARTMIVDLRSRWRDVAVSGGLVYNPGWHLALELDSLLWVAEATVLAAREGNQSRLLISRKNEKLVVSHWRRTWLANGRSESGAAIAAAGSKNIA